jgi:hypothetical protein
VRLRRNDEEHKRTTIMDIQCECGQFRARLKAFPHGTPGRLVCYCDDCQAYLHHLKRADLLDANGGTEVIPAYPADVEILSGREHLKCTRLSPTGTFRFFTACCNTPIVNTRNGEAWAGFLRGVYNAKELDQALGPVRSRFFGRYAKGTLPAGTPDTYDPQFLTTVIVPFQQEGKLLKRHKPSPFFTEDGTPIVTPHVLSQAERQAAASSAGAN